MSFVWIVLGTLAISSAFYQWGMIAFEASYPDAVWLFYGAVTSTVATFVFFGKAIT